MATVNPPRGMRDFLPPDKRKRDVAIRVISDTYRRHGFDPIETPVLEDHSTLHSGLGGDNEKLSFHVLKRGLAPEDFAHAKAAEDVSDLGLRFDLTVPLARFVASHHAELPSVFRALHVAPVWRAERPQKGRFRQFVQCDIDIVGEESTLAEREVLIATADALAALGLGDYRFRVNDRRLLTSLLTAAEFSPDLHPTVLITLDKLDKVGVDGVLAELGEKFPGMGDVQTLSAVLHDAAQGDIPWDADRISSLMSGEDSVAEHLASWAKDVESVVGEGRVAFDPTLVRGMGYYTGSIVELEHPELGVSMGGGGRYDGMVGRFLGKDMPAFGFSLGFERLIDLLDVAAGDEPPRVALLYSGDISPATVVRLKKELVAEGLSVRLVSVSRNMKAVFERLKTDGFERVAEVTADTAAASDLEWRALATR